MSGTPRFKIFDDEGRYVAAVVDLTLAALVVGNLPNGATVRDGHRNRRIIWREGEGPGDGFAADSYDGAAATMAGRIMR